MPRRKGTTPVGLPNTPRAIRRQAMQQAEASVQTARSIRKQYGRAQDDAAGFTDALVSLLQNQQGAYNSIAADSQAQQGAIDNAAVSRLAGLGDYSQGAMSATGALGTSAETRTNAASTALRAYGAQQPGIAASRGVLTQTGLNNALQDALDQRRTQLHQAFMQAYPQIQQNAFNERIALANLGLQRAQLNASISNNQAQLRLQERSLSDSEQHWALEFGQKYGVDPYTGKKLPGHRGRGGIGGLASRLGLTTNEVEGQVADATKLISGTNADVARIPIYKNQRYKDPATGKTKIRRILTGYKAAPVQGTGSPNIVQQGMGFGDALNMLLGQGIAKPIALWRLSSFYSQYGDAPNGTYEFDAYWSYRDWLARSSGQSQGTGNSPDGRTDRGQHR